MTNQLSNFGLKKELMRQAVKTDYLVNYLKLIIEFPPYGSGFRHHIVMDFMKVLPIAREKWILPKQISQSDWDTMTASHTSISVSGIIAIIC